MVWKKKNPRPGHLEAPGLVPKDAPKLERVREYQHPGGPFSSYAGFRCDVCQGMIKVGQPANLEWELTTLQSCWIVHAICSNDLRALKSEGKPDYELMWCWKPIHWSAN